MLIIALPGVMVLQGEAPLRTHTGSKVFGGLLLFLDLGLQVLFIFGFPYFFNMNG